MINKNINLSCGACQNNYDVYFWLLSNLGREGWKEVVFFVGRPSEAAAVRPSLPGQAAGAGRERQQQ